MTNIEKTSSIPRWQQDIQSAFTDVDELLDFLGLNVDDVTQYNAAGHKFPLLVTRSYAERIKKSDWSDPLLRQVMPLPDELHKHPAFITDPVGDGNASVMPGLIEKYHGRALIIATGACAIHCRYCFRREFPYSDNSANRSQIESINTHLQQHPDISEVILSGGDPLMLSDEKFRHLFDTLIKNPQIKRLRIHTRLPIVLPNRITTELLETLGSTTKHVIMVIHANHANELTPDVANVLDEIKQAGATLLNQTVLLKGINDTAQSLIQLSHRLFDCATLPYYLHVLDKVSGAAHFDCQFSATLETYKEVQRQLPGYLVPKLVKEEAGMPYKTLLQVNQ